MLVKRSGGRFESTSEPVADREGQTVDRGGPVIQLESATLRGATQRDRLGHSERLRGAVNQVASTCVRFDSNHPIPS